MASGQHIYDLTLLLDPAVEAERREQIVADIADLIDRTGEFIGRHDWGSRQTAYEVRKKAEADYHLIQFRGENELLEQLDHNLKITDGVLRHRIIKLRPGTPDPPDLRPSATPTTAPPAEPAAGRALDSLTSSASFRARALCLRARDASRSGSALSRRRPAQLP